MVMISFNNQRITCEIREKRIAAERKIRGNFEG
jgi:hypothetical protein